LEARGLAAPSSQCRPYVVATFEQNEFVSREAINENEEDATGQPMSPESSSQLRRSQKAGQVPSNNNSNNSQREEPMDTSTASAYNPVWKHEVALFVLLPCR
jgi:protein-serine/threonine kinase